MEIQKAKKIEKEPKNFNEIEQEKNFFIPNGFVEESKNNFKLILDLEMKKEGKNREEDEGIVEEKKWIRMR